MTTEAIVVILVLSVGLVGFVATVVKLRRDPDWPIIAVALLLGTAGVFMVLEIYRRWFSATGWP
jgi:hypothetical protein